MSVPKLLFAAAIALAALSGVAGSTHETSHAEHPCQWPGTWGDANDDGKVTSVDALLTLRVAASLDVHSACGPYDVDCDHDVDSVDALKILLYEAGLKYSQIEPCPDFGTSPASPDARAGGQ